MATVRKKKKTYSEILFHSSASLIVQLTKTDLLKQNVFDHVRGRHFLPVVPPRGEAATPPPNLFQSGVLYDYIVIVSR